jgi:hypothetical protein
LDNMSSLYQILQSGVDTPPVNHSHPLRDLTTKNPTSSAKSLGFSKILELIDQESEAAAVDRIKRFDDGEPPAEDALMQFRSLMEMQEEAQHDLHRFHMRKAKKREM